MARKAARGETNGIIRGSRLAESLQGEEGASGVEMLRNENSQNHVTETMFELTRFSSTHFVSVGMHFCGTLVCSGVRTRLLIIALVCVSCEKKDGENKLKRFR